MHNVTLDQVGGDGIPLGRRKAARLVAEQRVTVGQSVGLCLSGLLQYQE